MTHLRPQIVAAASIPPAEDTAVGPNWTRGRRPRAGRLFALAVLVWLCVATSPAAAKAETPTTVLRPLERSILTQVNAVRRQHGLVPLQLSAGLAAAARRHSIEMGSRGYFGHSSADGQAFDRRIAQFYPMGGRHYWSVGENLLWSSAELNAATALNLWLNSPKHRKMMLTARWREVGVGAVHVGSARGVYGGREVTIVTADFGVRR
jgi:uncharacterized protein YkwD